MVRGSGMQKNVKEKIRPGILEAISLLPLENQNCQIREQMYAHTNNHATDTTLWGPQRAPGRENWVCRCLHRGWNLCSECWVCREDSGRLTTVQWRLTILMMLSLKCGSLPVARKRWRREPKNAMFVGSRWWKDMLNAWSPFSIKELLPLQQSDPKTSTQQWSQWAVGTKEQAWQTFLPVSPSWMGSVWGWIFWHAIYCFHTPVSPRHDALSYFV